MRFGVASVGLVLLASCAASEGPLLHAADPGPQDSDSGPQLDAATPPGRPFVAPDAAWQYQLVGQVDPQLDAQLFFVDLFDVPSSLIGTLHASGKLAVAYLSAGTLEPFRDDAEQFPQSAVGRALDAYPNESWLDVRNDAVRARMAERLDVARDKGFDGVLPTNLTAYQHDSGFDLSADDQAQYSEWLAEQSHQRSLVVGISGDFTRLDELGAHFDFAMEFGCIARDECALLDPFPRAGKPVFDAETEGDPDQVCMRAAELKLNVILKRSDYGAYRMACP